MKNFFNTKSTVALSTIAITVALTLTPAAVAEAPRSLAEFSGSSMGFHYTNQNLIRLVRGLGYQFSDVGNNTYEIPMNRNGVKFDVRIYLSESEKKLWLSVCLADAMKMPVDIAPKLVQADQKVGPAMFTLYKNMLYLWRPVDNRDLTPEIVRAEVEKLAGSVVETKDLWTVKL